MWGLDSVVGLTAWFLAWLSVWHVHQHKEDASIKEGHNEPLAKEGDNGPLAKDGNWLGTTMSPLPQGQLAAYVMQDDNEPIPTKGLRTVYAMQGNHELLTTIGDWATTFNNCEGTKTLTI
jgi:hypothetical protein